MGTTSNGSGWTKVVYTTKLSGKYSAAIRTRTRGVGASIATPAVAVRIHLYLEGRLKQKWVVNGSTVSLTFADGEMAVIEAVATETQL